MTISLCAYMQKRRGAPYERPPSNVGPSTPRRCENGVMAGPPVGTFTHLTTQSSVTQSSLISVLFSRGTSPILETTLWILFCLLVAVPQVYCWEDVRGDIKGTDMYPFSYTTRRTGEKWTDFRLICILLCSMVSFLWGSSFIFLRCRS